MEDRLLKTKLSDNFQSGLDCEALAHMPILRIDDVAQ